MENTSANHRHKASRIELSAKLYVVTPNSREHTGPCINHIFFSPTQHQPSRQPSREAFAPAFEAFPPAS